MAAIETAAIKAIIDAATVKAAEEAVKLAAGGAAALQAGVAGIAAEAAAGAAVAEIEKLIVAKAAELATPAGLKKAAVTAAAQSAGTAAKKAVKKKIKSNVREKTGISFDADVKLTILEKKLLLYFRKADEDARKQALDLLEENVGEIDDSCVLIDTLLGKTEPGMKETIEAVKEYIEDEKE